jgi:hypothetical protein
MSNHTETLQISQYKDFRAEALLKDPNTGFNYSIQLEVDTGNPDAISLPHTHSIFFTEKLYQTHRAGAGTGLSDCYKITLESFGNLSIDHTTVAVMTLKPQSNSDDYGLIGIDLLKYMEGELFGGPQNPKLSLEPTHL